MRAFAAAVHNLFGTLPGLGLGALFVGAMSDYLQPHFGAAAVKYALIAPILCFVPAGALYLMASLTITRDVARAEEGSTS